MPDLDLYTLVEPYFYSDSEWVVVGRNKDPGAMILRSGLPSKQAAEAWIRLAFEAKYRKEFE